MMKKEMRKNHDFCQLKMLMNFTASEILMPTRHCIIFWDNSKYPFIFSIITKTTQVRLCLVIHFYREKYYWHKPIFIKIKRNASIWHSAYLPSLHSTW